MKTSTSERLNSLVEFLSAQIAFLRSLGLDDPARLLEMARLEIRLRRYSVTDEELCELCAALSLPEPATDEGAPVAARPSAARTAAIETRVLPMRGPRKHAR